MGREINHMLQDLKKVTYHNEFHAYDIQDDDYVMILRKKQLYACVKDNMVSYPTYKEVKDDLKGEITYLFAMGEQRYFLAESETVSLDGYDYVSFMWNHAFHPHDLTFAGITAIQLGSWYQSNRFCGCCGQPIRRDNKERKIVCDACGYFEYPKIAPAIIVGVMNGDKLLLSEYLGGTGEYYAMLAGFAEVGESIEDCVRREVREEVGIEVKNITYYKSQPWSYSDSLLFGFYCEVDGDDTLTVDHGELKRALWMPREKIPEQYDHVSITSEMMMHFKHHMG